MSRRAPFGPLAEGTADCTERDSELETVTESCSGRALVWVACTGAFCQQSQVRVRPEQHSAQSSPQTVRPKTGQRTSTKH